TLRVRLYRWPGICTLSPPETGIPKGEPTMKLTTVIGVGLLLLLAACKSSNVTVNPGASDVRSSASAAASLLAKEACGRFQKLYADIQRGTVTADKDVLAGVVEVETLARNAGASKVADIAKRMQDDISSSDLNDLQKASADLTVECAKEGAPL